MTDALDKNYKDMKKELLPLIITFYWCPLKLFASLLLCKNKLG